ncbi:MAG TPA: hypothetical protein VLC91_00165, partial [Spongiibacteraceae bacterium]|nr:hypothetical protein [Spongiibacteraceae bacterium]
MQTTTETGKPLIYTLEQLAATANPYRHGAHSPLAAQPLIVADLNTPLTLAIDEQIIFNRWLRQQPCPTIAIGAPEHPLAQAFDVLLTATATAVDRDIERLAANIARTPLAAMVLVQVLRATESMPAAQALLVESLAYATLQTGAEFKRWLATRPAPLSAPDNEQSPLSVQRDDELLTLRINR